MNISITSATSVSRDVCASPTKQQHLTRNTSKKATRAVRLHVSSLTLQDSGVHFVGNGLPIEDVNNLEIRPAADMIAQCYQLLNGRTHSGFADLL